MILLNNLSVLIVTWKGDGLLKNCLDSLCNIYGDSLEIVVVDNANEESTKRLVSGFENVKYLASESNVGFAGGNNLGFAECSRKYVLLLNDIIHKKKCVFPTLLAKVTPSFPACYNFQKVLP